MCSQPIADNNTFFRVNEKHKNIKAQNDSKSGEILVENSDKKEKIILRHFSVSPLPLIVEFISVFSEVEWTEKGSLCLLIDTLQKIMAAKTQIRQIHRERVFLKEYKKAQEAEQKAAIEAEVARNSYPRKGFFNSKISKFSAFFST